MTATDGNDSVGYVICGYLDRDGVETTTVEGEPYSGRPYETIEEAVAEIDANGGPRPDANIFIGAVVPIALVIQSGSTAEEIAARRDQVEDAFGEFFVIEDEDDVLVKVAGKGYSESLNFGEGALD